MNPLRWWPCAASAVTLAKKPLLVPAHAQGVIKIMHHGYKAQPAFLEPLQEGHGTGRRRDQRQGRHQRQEDRAQPRRQRQPRRRGARGRRAHLREKIDVLAGAFLSNTGLALTDFAKEILHLLPSRSPAGDRLEQRQQRLPPAPRPTCRSRCWCPRPPSFKKKRWALVYPNYEYGQSSVATFKTLPKAAQPDVEFVAEQAPLLGKVDQAMRWCRPESKRTATTQHRRPVLNVYRGEQMTS